MNKIYVISKTKHVGLWLDLRESGLNIISKWIDLASYKDKPHSVIDFSKLAVDCLEQIRECDYCIMYVEPADIMKYTLVEAGAALAFKKNIYVIGYNKQLEGTFLKHPKVFHCNKIMPFQCGVKGYILTFLNNEDCKIY